MYKIDVNAPILPGQSIANILLGSPIESLGDHQKNARVSKRFIGETSFFLFNETICVTTHNLSQRIFRISALCGYQGLFLGIYRPNMPIDPLLVDPCWKFDESQGGLLSENYPGIIIGCDVEDPTFEDLKGRKIGDISVFVDNIDRLDQEWKA